MGSRVIRAMGYREFRECKAAGLGVPASVDFDTFIIETRGGMEVVKPSEPELRPRP